MADLSATPKETLATPITKLFGITHPILLAGMNVAAGPELAAAVTNAGGMGVIGGVGYTPDFLREQIDRLKTFLKDKNAPFGVDLLLPKVGEGARKTNYDYTEGKLPELVKIIVESGCRLFVSAVGVPPKWVVDEMHKAKIPVMNMVGSVKHVKYALEVGCDIICAQGTEGGGHTGEIASSVLIPKVVDVCKAAKSPLTGGPVLVLAAGGIFDGRGLAAALNWGADGVWVGTRFVCAKEAGAPPRHQQAIIKAGYHDTVRTLVFTGRPLRILKNDYVMDWETNRQAEMKELLSKGTLPYQVDIDKRQQEGGEVTADDMRKMMESRPLLMGQAAAAIDDIKPAATIINEMVNEAIQILRSNVALIKPVPARAKL